MSTTLKNLRRTVLAIAILGIATTGSSALASAFLDPNLVSTLQSLDSSSEIGVIVKMRESWGRRIAQGKHAQEKVRARGGRRGGHRHLKTAFTRDRARRNRVLRRNNIIPDYSLAAPQAGAFSQGSWRKRQKSLWLINGIAITASKANILSLADDPSVLEIVLDKTITLADPAVATNATPEWNLSAVGADSVWNQGYAGAGVVVAVMDTGVDVLHPDLSFRWRGGTNSWLDLSDPFQATPRDSTGHGTQVMGLILAGDLFGSPIGMAPDASWIAAKIFDDQGDASISDIHLAFQWFIDPDGNPNTSDAPHIVNASWALLSSLGNCNLEFAPDIEALEAAGISVVFAAGNSGPGPGTSLSPADGGKGLAVGSVNSNLDVSLGSSRGPSQCTGGIFPDISAPGVAIWTTDKSFGGFPFYTQMTGTSFAAPHISGGLALLRQAHPDASVAELEASIRETAYDLGPAGPDNDHGQGLVDFDAALQWLDAGPGCNSSPTALDSDLDGIADVCDNCTLVANAAQRDTDGDGYGNRCDADFDNDGTVSFQDVVQFINAFGTNDPDADFDGDGYVNFFDVVVLLHAYLAPPGPSALAP
jgi:subtilisin family serine protease